MGNVKVTRLPRRQVCDTRRMRNQAPAPTHKRHRFPPEIIGHAVWLYFRFALSYRDVEELLAECGAFVTFETVRQWCRTFGREYANALRRQRPRPGATWHLDAVFIPINGRRYYLWRAVDQAGQILDILVQSRRKEILPQAAQRPCLRPPCRHHRHVGQRRGGLAGCCRAWSIAGTKSSTTAPSTPTSQRGNGNGGCGGSRAPATRNASSPLTVPSSATAARAATA